MASGDIITRLVLDHSKHDQGLQQSKRALENYASGATSVDGVVKNLITTFGKYVSVAGAVTAAMKVAKDAFFENEQQLDEWGRVCESSKSLYDGFLSALNNADISGFLNNMESIVSAAREAYDALDELNTFKAFNQVNKARNKAGYAEALERYKKNPTAENKQALAAANQAVVGDLKAEAGKSQTAYQKALKSLFGSRTYSKNDIAALSNMFQTGSYADIVNAKASYKEYGLVESAKKGYLGNLTEFNGKRVGNVDGKGFYMNASGGIAKEMSAAEQSAYQIARALSQVNDTQIQEVQSLGAQAFQLNEAAAQQTRSYNRLAGNNGKVGGSSSGGKSGKSTTQAAATETAIPGAELIDDDYLAIVTVNLANKADEWGQTISEHLKASLEDGTANLSDAIDLSSIDDVFAESLNAEKLKKYNKQVKGTQNAWNAAASAISSAGQALSSTGDTGMNVAGIIMQAVANIALGFAQADAHSGSEGNVWTWIAASVAGIATMVSTIAAVKSATAGSYADGGVIGGNSYVGDKLYARVNSGETILSASQAQTALDMMDNNKAFAGGSSQPYCHAETIFFGLNNWGKRTGRGELVFSRS